MSQEIVCYPFSLGIPWRLDENDVIEPYISNEVWKVFLRGKNATIVCPGYLLEAYVASFAPSILSNYGVTVNRWIMPEYYSSMVKFLAPETDESTFSKDENLFEGFYRISEVIDCYPAPIFFDAKDNVYFNMLFNYSDVFNKDGEKTDVVIDSPYWKQMLNNLCVDSKVRNNQINKDKLKKRFNVLLSKLGLLHKDKYVLLDNSNVFGTLASGKVLNGKIFLEHEINHIADVLSVNKIQLLVLTKNNIISYSKNCHAINIWPKIDSFDLISILANVSSVISPDPNIYIMAAMFGCKNIIAIGNKLKNMSFEDFSDISLCGNKFGYVYIRPSEFKSERVAELVY